MLYRHKSKPQLSIYWYINMMGSIKAVFQEKYKIELYLSTLSFSIYFSCMLLFRQRSQAFTVKVPVTREIFSEFCWIKPNLDCFPNDLTLDGKIYLCVCKNSTGLYWLVEHAFVCEWHENVNTFAVTIIIESLDTTHLPWQLQLKVSTLYTFPVTNINKSLSWNTCGNVSIHWDCIDQFKRVIFLEDHSLWVC